MNSDWSLYQVADLIAQEKLVVGDGYRAKNDELSVVGLPFARAGNIDNGFYFDGADCFPEERIARVGNKVSKPGDVVFTSKGTVGRFAFVGEDTKRFVYSPQLCFWRSLDRNTIHPRFLYYWMSGLDFYGQFKGVAGQTDMAEYVSLTDQRRMNMTLPPLPEQKAIAGVLGSLDDKIELNRRMNATLEAMAQALFQSWFVDFDPVRAKSEGRTPSGMDAATAALLPSEFEQSTLGPIPAGWRVGELGEVAEILDSLRIPLSVREREKRRGEYPYYGAASRMDCIDDFIFDGIYLLMGEDGSVVNEDGTPVLQYVWGKFWVNNHAHVLRGKNGFCTEHLLLHLKTANIASFVTGAVQAKLNQGNMKRISIVVPQQAILTAFQQTIAPLYASIRANIDSNQALANMRDTLLPKLLSGELPVTSASEYSDVAL